MEITIVEYNPEWKIFFENEKKILKDIFLNQYKTINHIGSTSVMGLDSKPIVDISIGVSELKEQDFYTKFLKMCDYKYQTGSKFEKWFLFEKRIQKQKFNLHIMKYDNKRLLDQLIFKHCLTDNKELINNYGWLKKYYKEHDDNLFYSMNKLPFVTNVVKGFKEGFLGITKKSDKEFYKYIQDNFTQG